MPGSSDEVAALEGLGLHRNSWQVESSSGWDQVDKVVQTRHLGTSCRERFAAEGTPRRGSSHKDCTALEQMTVRKLKL
jgi:hypothetical protein